MVKNICFQEANTIKFHLKPLSIPHSLSHSWQLCTQALTRAFLGSNPNSTISCVTLNTSLNHTVPHFSHLSIRAITAPPTITVRIKYVPICKTMLNNGELSLLSCLSEQAFFCVKKTDKEDCGKYARTLLVPECKVLSFSTSHILSLMDGNHGNNSGCFSVKIMPGWETD